MNDRFSTSSASSSSSSGGSITNNISQLAAENNAKNKKLFPKKLWDLINNEKYYYCLRWSEDGQLVYLNRDEFEDSYLKTAENQFHTQKAISFVRQMNMYGFRKVDDCYYENDYFKRGCEHLLKNMIRKHPNKNQQHQQPRQTFHQQQGQQLTSGDMMIPRHVLFNNSARTHTQTTSASPMDHNSGHMPAPPLVRSQSPTVAAPMNPLGAGADFQTFYALLSSLSNNLYGQQASLPNYQGSSFVFDTVGGQFPTAATLPQQIYQSLLTPQPRDDGQVASASHLYSAASTTTRKDLPSHRGVASPIQAPKWANPTASSQTLLDRVTSATSLLASSTASSNTANDLSLKNLRNCKDLRANFTSSPRSSTPGDDDDYSSSSSSSRSPPQRATNCPPMANDASSPDTFAQRRDYRPVRSFKRSIDSILNSNDSDTNDNNNSNRIAGGRITKPFLETSNKRSKLVFYQQQPTNDKLKQRPTGEGGGGGNTNVNVSGANELAKNLVSEIALSRDALLDSNVLLEASKYTEGFVQTLFDTALVIARHSNGLNLSDYMLTASDATCQPKGMDQNVCDNNNGDEDDNDEAFSVGGQHDGPEYERSNISVSDLTSALKLLPSKLLKILK